MEHWLQVDHTTLGRPAQKRKGFAQSAPDTQTTSAGHGHEPSNDDSTFVEETAEKDFKDFLMANPNGEPAHLGEIRNMKSSKMELSTSLLSPFHLMGALLERDKHFASNILPDDPSAACISDIVDDSIAIALDPQ